MRIKTVPLIGRHGAVRGLEIVVRDPVDVLQLRHATNEQAAQRLADIDRDGHPRILAKRGHLVRAWNGREDEPALAQEVGNRNDPRCAVQPGVGDSHERGSLHKINGDVVAQDLGNLLSLHAHLLSVGVVGMVFPTDGTEFSLPAVRVFGQRRGIPRNPGLPAYRQPMRELRFVMPSEDDSHVVVETSSNVGFERFRLPITDALRAAVSPEPEAPAAEPPAADTAAEAPEDDAPARRPLPAPATPVAAAAAETPAISPREIQMRVRSGELPEHIAELFNASLDWVMRFAGPVIEERGRLTDEARRARARRSTADAQTVVFGETVDSRFSGHGIDPSLVEWDSHRREDGQWVITAHWVGGESERTAEWAFNLSSRTVTAIDETASDLLSDRPIRPVFTDAPVTLTTAPPLAPGVVAFPARPNAHTGPLPTREQLFDQHAFNEEAAKAPTPLVYTPPAAATPPAAQELTFDEMELPLDITHDTLELDAEIPELEEIDEPEPTVRVPQVTNLGIAHKPRGETEDEKAARAHIPSWDDILLGVRRKND